MSEAVQHMRDMRTSSESRRAVNRDRGAALLTEAGIAYASHNGGAHLVVTALGQTWDYWPGTGLWQRRGAPRQVGRGIRLLISACTPMEGL